MKSFRRERFDSLIQKEISKLIVEELEFTGSLVTVTGVGVSGDLETAVVWIGVIPEDNTQSVLDVLNKSKSYLQSLLARKLKIRRVPKINFELDRGAESAAKVEKSLLKDYNNEDKAAL